MLVTTCLRDRLRAATREDHLRIEDGLARATRPWTLTAYAAFLLGTLDVVRRVEPGIDRFGTAMWAQPRPAGWAVGRLHHDLRTIGVLPAWPSAPGSVPFATTPAAAFGAAYVIEGSRLGAPTIAAALERDLRLPAAALTYLRPPGDPAGARWREFVQRLDAFGTSATPTDFDRTIETGRETFAAFRRAFVARGVG